MYPGRRIVAAKFFSELGIASVDLKELIGGGCNKSTNAIRVKYGSKPPIWVMFPSVSQDKSY